MTIADIPAKPNALPLVAYLVCVVWVVMESSKRWMALLQMVASLASVVALAYLLSRAVPSYTLAIADLAGIIAMLVSAVVGWNYMKAHRRTPPPK
jgi:K+-sensing histidine kinase KdpD